MFRLLLTFLLSGSFFTGMGQEKSIEFSLSGRYDKHGDFTTRYGNRSYTNDIELWGTSYGIQLNYLHPVTNALKLSVGAGYYRLGINKIKNTSTWNSNGSSRTIDYTHPTGIQPLFHTDKYHYNNLSFTLGVTYEHQLSDKVFITAGADYFYWYTFSQSYRITYDETQYKTTNGKKMGSGANASIGLLKKLNNNRYYINPKIIIPVYQQLNGDKVFREDESVIMEKWLNGLGLSISIGKYL